MSVLGDGEFDVNEAALVARNIANQVDSSYRQIVTMYETGLRRFWQNPKATPQEIADQLGVRAAKVFSLHGALYQLIKTANPQEALTELSSVGDFTANEDGSITITRVGPPSEE